MPETTELPGIVTDISLIGRWEPRKDGTCAEVLLNAKIIPRPSAKVPLLHLQRLVERASLVNVESLLPDGLSASPQRQDENNNNPTPKLERLPTAGFSSTGPGFSSEEWRSNDDSISDASRVHGNCKPKTVIAVASGNDSKDPRSSNVLGIEGLPDDRSLQPSLVQETSHSGSPTKYFVPPLSIEKVAYSRDGHGQMKRVDAYDWDRVFTFNSIRNGHSGKTPRKPRYSGPSTRFPDGRGRLLSGSSYTSVRDLSPMSSETQKMFRDVLLNASLHACKTSERRESEGKENGEPPNLVDIQQNNPNQNQVLGTVSISKECCQVTIIVEDDTLFAWFPRKLPSAAVLVQVALSVRPLLLDQKSYYTFILCGLPRCRKGAYFEFEVTDEHEGWAFDVQPASNVDVESSGYDVNKVSGQVKLDEQASSSRMLVLRILSAPSSAEIRDFKIKTKTCVRLTWFSENNVVADFEISVYFINVEAQLGVARSLITLLLLNGPESQTRQHLSVISESGAPLQFSIENALQKNGEILQGCQFLLVSRMMLDVWQSMTISFRRPIEAIPSRLDIPLIETGNERGILEQQIVVFQPQLPLKLICKPSSACWREVEVLTGQEIDDIIAKKFQRVISTGDVEYPGIHIRSLQLAKTRETDMLDTVPRASLRYIDKVQYDFEEHSHWKSTNPMPLHVRMSFKMDRSSSWPGEHGAEICRLYGGSFHVEFATLNGKPVQPGCLFYDREDLVLLNYGIFPDSNKLSLELFFKGITTLTRTTLKGEKILELGLPQMLRSVVGRVVCKYAKQDAWISARMRQRSGSYTVAFFGGRATLSGNQTFDSRLYLQLPRSNQQGSIPSSRLTSSESEETVTVSSHLEDHSVPSSFESLVDINENNDYMGASTHHANFTATNELLGHPAQRIRLESRQYQIMVSLIIWALVACYLHDTYSAVDITPSHFAWPVDLTYNLTVWDADDIRPSSDEIRSELEDIVTTVADEQKEGLEPQGAVSAFLGYSFADWMYLMVKGWGRAIFFWV